MRLDERRRESGKIDLVLIHTDGTEQILADNLTVRFALKLRDAYYDVMEAAWNEGYAAAYIEPMEADK